MNEMNDRLGGDEALAADYRAAHEAYLASRAEIGARSGIGAVPEIDGISAGGMPTRVKCLHVLVGHSLAAGPGVNPLGDEAIAAISRVVDHGPLLLRRRLGHRRRGALAGPQQARTAGTSGDRGAACPGPEAAHRRPRQHRRCAESRHRPRGRPVTRVAAVDCGTNSIRLLIADVDTDGAAPRLKDVVREMRVVRLGQGVDATGELAQEALDRTFAAAADYAGQIRGHGATKVRFVATSATRDARNRQVFVDGIRELLGVEPEVITGDEEAALSFAGASSVLPSRGADPVLVVDLGGGSTEFVLGNADGVIAAKSVDIGCVRMTERHLRSDPPTAEQIAAAEADVDAALEAGGPDGPAGPQRRRRRGRRFHHHHHGARARAAGVLRRGESTALNCPSTPCAAPARNCWR